MNGSDNPNYRDYNSLNLGTWSSVSDADVFLSKFCRANAYKNSGVSLAIGNYVTIKDGTYDTIWEIAGFDMESNQKAADETLYDNGYGICMIPKTYIIADQWNDSDTTEGGYMSSCMHTTLLPNIVFALQNVLGNHIVNRNVLLSSNVSPGIDSIYNASAYTWTRAYATLMNFKQVYTSRIIGSDCKSEDDTVYDIGEATYYLPIFDNENYYNTSPFWLRSISGYDSAYTYGNGDGCNYRSVTITTPSNIRPMIYIR